MNELEFLYQELILDHGRHPRHLHVLPEKNHEAIGFNPVCGDKVSVYAQVEQGALKQVAFTGKGCAISMASASMMCESLQNKTLPVCEATFVAFRDLLTKPDTTPEQFPMLGKLSVLAGVKAYPGRVKCATLAWHTLRNALHNKGNTTTES